MPNYSTKYSDGENVDKLVYRPFCASVFFDHCAVIDHSNQQRQSELRLEKIWVSRCGYFRINTTFLGINVVDTFHTYRHHLTFTHVRHKHLGLMNFVKMLARDFLKSTRSHEVLMPLDSFNIDDDDDEGSSNGNVFVQRDGNQDVPANEPLTQDTDDSEDDESEDEKLPPGFWDPENHRLIRCEEIVVTTKIKKKMGKDGRMMNVTVQRSDKRRGRCVYCQNRTRYFCAMCKPPGNGLRHWCCSHQQSMNRTGSDESTNSSNNTGRTTRSARRLAEELNGRTDLSCSQIHCISFTP